MSLSIVDVFQTQHGMLLDGKSNPKNALVASQMLAKNQTNVKASMAQDSGPLGMLYLFA